MLGQLIEVKSDQLRTFNHGHDSFSQFPPPSPNFEYSSVPISVAQPCATKDMGIINLQPCQTYGTIIELISTQ